MWGYSPKRIERNGKREAADFYTRILDDPPHFGQSSAIDRRMGTIGILESETSKSFLFGFAYCMHLARGPLKPSEACAQLYSASTSSCIAFFLIPIDHEVLHLSRLELPRYDS